MQDNQQDTQRASHQIRHTLKQMPYWQALIYGVACGYITMLFLLTQSGSLTEREQFWAVLLIGALIGVVILNRLYTPLVRLMTALHLLSRGEPVQPIPVGRFMLFRESLRAVNVLIAQQQETGQARGQLYRQIGEAAAQEERNRLARDLHDSIKQQIFSISVSAAAAQARLEADPPDIAHARAALADVRQSAQEAMVEMRAMLQQLSPAPLEKAGLVQALRDQCEALAYRTGAQVITHFGTLPPDDRLPLGAQETIFRIAQEALANIARHARAHTVYLTLSLDETDRLRLTVRDDGQGFDTGQASAGMGLANMGERAAALAGHLHLESTPGAGTALELTIPIESQTHISETEEMMQTRHEAQFRALLPHLAGFGIATAALLLCVSLIATRMLNQPVETLQDIFLTVLLILMTIGSLIAIPVMVWHFISLRRGAALLIASAGEGHPSVLKLYRHLALTYTGIAVVGFWITPLAWIGERFPRELPLLTALFFLAIIGWQYLSSFLFYNREMALMTPEQRREEISQQSSLMRGSWTSTAMLVFIVMITDTFRNGIQLMPVERDEWVTTALILITAMLVFNQIANLLYYRWHQQRLERAEAAA